MSFRLVEELVHRHNEAVTVILPSKRRNHGPQISRVPTVRVVENEQLDADAFTAARIGHAKALALMVQDDVGNIHAAMRALEITDIRVVVRVYNTGLGTKIEGLLGDCVLLSDASMATPSFVAAALGQVEPRYLSIGDRTVFVTTPQAARSNDPVWPISSAESEILLPGDDVSADLVITATARRPRRLGERSRHRVRRLFSRFWDEMREILDRKLRFVTLFLVLVIAAGTFLIWDFHDQYDQTKSISWATAVYITLLAAAGGIDPDLAAPAAEKFAHTLVSFAGVLLVPVFTASIVENMVGRKLAMEAGRLRGPISDHVIVVGLGNVGTQIATQLNALGVPVVAIERDERSRGVDAAKGQGIPVVYGDASQLETLESAQARTCRALIAVTSNDIVNLEAALHAREMRDDLKTVLRLFEPDLAERVQRKFGLSSLSVAGVAAAEFAAAMTDQTVKGSIPVGRHLLLVGEVTIEAESDLDGHPVSEVAMDGHLRVMALSKGNGLMWAPHPNLVMTPGDRLFVLATRRGLSTLVNIAKVPQEPEPAQRPIVPPQNFRF